MKAFVKRFFPCAKKCSGIDQYSRGILGSGGFLCDECVQYIHKMDTTIGDIQENVKKQHLAEYKGEFKDCLKQNENEIKELLEGIEKRCEERSKKLYEAQMQSDVNVKEISQLYGVINENLNKNKKMCNIIELKSKVMCNEIKKQWIK